MADAPLLTHIKAHIRAHGFMDVETYITTALYDPTHGYYATQTVIGREGDYITAPEMSQAFGEVLALWFINLWQEGGHGAPVRLIELGGGKGTLMADMLRTFRLFPAFNTALTQVVIVDKSPLLRAQQHATLTDPRLDWVEETSALPPFTGLTFIVANEFLDALPIQQYWQNGDVRRITLGANGNLMWEERDEPLVETCPGYEPILTDLNNLLEGGGAALIIDYGYHEGQLLKNGSSLQGMRAHRYAPVSKAPGQTDITHHVNFSHVLACIDPRYTTHLTTQGAFLTALRLWERTQKLCQKATLDEQNNLITAAARLTAPTHMGELFKVLTITYRL
jgi:SAM-dependent MidA family methyltransferase